MSIAYGYKVFATSDFLTKDPKEAPPALKVLSTLAVDGWECVSIFPVPSAKQNLVGAVLKRQGGAPKEFVEEKVLEPQEIKSTSEVIITPAHENEA